MSHILPQVSPTELEKGLMRLPGVAEAGVIGIPDEKSDEAPVAFVVRSDPDLTAEQVHTFMEQRFAKHKQLAGGVRFVEQLPKNHLGKLLRRKLRDLL